MNRHNPCLADCHTEPIYFLCSSNSQFCIQCLLQYNFLHHRQHPILELFISKITDFYFTMMSLHSQSSDKLHMISMQHNEMFICNSLRSNHLLHDIEEAASYSAGLKIPYWYDSCQSSQKPTTGPQPLQVHIFKLQMPKLHFNITLHLMFLLNIWKVRGSNISCETVYHNRVGAPDFPQSLQAYYAMTASFHILPSSLFTKHSPLYKQSY